MADTGDIPNNIAMTAGQVIRRNAGDSAFEAFTPSGTGDVSKVGTPVNNQVGVWTGDGTIEGDTALTFDTSTDTLATVNVTASGDVTVADEAYGSGWNGSTEVPTKNAVYDKIETISSASTANRVITVILDGGGSALTTGAQKVYASVPYSGTITKWRILALDGNTGSITLDIWKDTYANFAPTDADSITASDQPAISASNKNEGTSLTGWTTSVTEGDIVEVNIDSVSTFTKVKLELFIEATS
jgi:hypothetical protein